MVSQGPLLLVGQKDDQPECQQPRVLPLVPHYNGLWALGQSVSLSGSQFPHLGNKGYRRGL